MSKGKVVRMPRLPLNGYRPEAVETAIVWSRNLKPAAEGYAVRFLAFMVGNEPEEPGIPASVSFASARGIRESIKAFLGL